MALIPCRECGRDVSGQAATCPHCGVPDPTPKLGPERPSGLEVLRADFRQGWERWTTSRARYVVAGVLFLAVGASWVADNRRSTFDIRDTEVKVDCERAVVERMRSPSSAEIITNRPVRETSDLYFEYSGVVEAPNAFGVMLRQPFDCVVTWQSGWQVRVTFPESP